MAEPCWKFLFVCLSGELESQGILTVERRAGGGGNKEHVSLGFVTKKRVNSFSKQTLQKFNFVIPNSKSPKGALLSRGSFGLSCPYNLGKKYGLVMEIVRGRPNPEFGPRQIDLLENYELSHFVTSN